MQLNTYLDPWKPTPLSGKIIDDRTYYDQSSNSSTKPCMVLTESVFLVPVASYWLAWEWGLAELMAVQWRLAFPMGQTMISKLKDATLLANNEQKEHVRLYGTTHHIIKYLFVIFTFCIYTNQLIKFKLIVSYQTLQSTWSSFHLQSEKVVSYQRRIHIL